MLTNLLINGLLSTSLNSLWSMANGLQLIVHLPLYSIVTPPNAQMLLAPMVNVANFDMIPTFLFYPYIFNYGDSDPYNKNFAFAGYDSGYLAENMGTNFCLTHVAISGLIALAILKYTIKRAARQQTKESKKINQYIFLAYKPYFKLKEMFSWNVIIRSALETYMEAILCGLAIIMTMPWGDEINDRLNCFYGIFYFISAIVFPPALFFFYKKHKDHLYETTFMHKYGGGYEGLKSPMDLDSQLMFRRQSSVVSIAMPMIFIARRMVFAFSVVLINGDGATALLPILYCFELNWVALEFIISAKPYENNKDNIMDIFNECTLIILMFFVLAFTEWMPHEDINSVIKYTLGWVFAGIVFIYITIHFIVMIHESLKVSCMFTIQTMK